MTLCGVSLAFKLLSDDLYGFHRLNALLCAFVSFPYDLSRFVRFFAVLTILYRIFQDHLRTVGFLSAGRYLSLDESAVTKTDAESQKPRALEVL
jgi:hypothetical protein